MCPDRPKYKTKQAANGGMPSEKVIGLFLHSPLYFDRCFSIFTRSFLRLFFKHTPEISRRFKADGFAYFLNRHIGIAHEKDNSAVNSIFIQVFDWRNTKGLPEARKKTRSTHITYFSKGVYGNFPVVVFLDIFNR